MYQLHDPNTRMWEKFDPLLCHMWWRVVFVGKDLFVTRFHMYIAVVMASDQNCMSTYLWYSTNHTKSSKVRFTRSATPFCWGVYATVNWCWIPLSIRYCLNSFDRYSPPLSERSNFNLISLVNESDSFVWSPRMCILRSVWLASTSAHFLYCLNFSRIAGLLHIVCITVHLE